MSLKLDANRYLLLAFTLQELKNISLGSIELPVFGVPGSGIIHTFVLSLNDF
jgi:hypothetical protein